MDLCVDMLWDQPMEQLKQSTACYREYRASLERRRQAKWRSLAHTIDEFSRFWVPLCYVLAICFVGSIKLEDRYQTPMNEKTLRTTDIAEWKAHRHEGAIFVVDVEGNERASASRWGVEGANENLLRFPMSDYLAAIKISGLSVGNGMIGLVCAFVAIVVWLWLRARRRREKQMEQDVRIHGSQAMREYTERTSERRKTIAPRPDTAKRGFSMKRLNRSDA